MKSKQRHSGGSYRRMKTMISYHAKAGKDRHRTKMYTMPQTKEEK